MVNLIFLAAEDDGDDVETYLFGNIFASQIHVGGADKVLLFLWGDEGLRFAENGAAACFYLAKHEIFLVNGDQIHFQVVAFPVSVEYDIVVLSEEFCR